MNKGTIVNSLLVASVLLLLAGFAFIVRVRPTADRVALLSAGKLPEVCRIAIQKALQTKGGVASIEIDQPGAKVVVGYDSKKIGAAELASAVTEAGYPARIDHDLTVEQYRTSTGGKIGAGLVNKPKCGCEEPHK